MGLFNVPPHLKKKFKNGDRVKSGIKKYANEGAKAGIQATEKGMGYISNEMKTRYKEHRDYSRKKRDVYRKAERQEEMRMLRAKARRKIRSKYGFKKVSSTYAIPKKRKGRRKVRYRYEEVKRERPDPFGFDILGSPSGQSDILGLGNGKKRKKMRII